MTEVLQVAVAVFVDDAKRLLITQRASRARQGGLWEFPGGKLEPGETAEQALFREVKEELGVDIVQAKYLHTVTYVYPAYSVVLNVYHVSDYTGNVSCCEDQQDLRWITFEELTDYQLLDASRQLIPLIMIIFG